MTSRPLRVSVVIPALNEERTLRAVVDAVREALSAYDLEVVIVDDGSSDATPRVIAELAAADSRVRCARHERPRGKGSAVRTGFALASGDVLVIQDADLEYSPRDIPSLLGPIEAGVADAVYGSRFLGAEHSVNYFWTTLANKLITLTANVVYNTNFTDLYTGYKAMRAELVKPLHLTAATFTIEAELTAKLHRTGARFYEVPIRYRARSYREGKKIRASDALRAVSAIVAHRFTRLKAG
ncbi:MAG: glycosyltransferase family 2 protein [Deltaproteobacteria bacterium]|nr:glycosyltransferase family 2 protein [Deltaproteobacteria bacterium]